MLFEELKKTLSTAPVLAAPTDKEPMLLYVAANERVVSAVVVVERKEEGKEHLVQCPISYVSEVLTDSKQRYPQWQKLVYGVFLASRKLKHYFQEHAIKVVSSAPLADIIRTEMRRDESPSGQLNWVLTTSHMSRGQLSSHKLWRILSMIGPTSHLHQTHLAPSIG